MNKTRKLTLASAFAVLAAASAPAAQAQSFDGPFVGVQAGWNQNDIADIDGVATPGEVQSDSFVGGVFAGYDYQTESGIVVGVEAGFSLGVEDDFGYAAGTSQVSIDPDYSFDVSARLGYAVTEGTLVYGRGGYANTRADVRIAEAGAVTFADDETYDGWFAGGGVEQRITDNFNARLEYRYSDLGSDTQEFERHQVLAGVSYRF